MKSILIVDDEKNILKTLALGLRGEGYAVLTAGNGQEARSVFAAGTPDLVLLDIYLPDASGLELLAAFKQQAPDTVVIVMSGHGTVRDAVEATRSGAHEFFEKPVSLEKLLVTIERALEFSGLKQENRALTTALLGPDAMIGDSPAIKAVRKQIEQAAPTEARVLITGESGTGKELVARALHNLSRRSAKPFVKFNTAAIPVALAESELFGYEKGAFTGADTRREGKFHAAHQGTLFLDEIGDMSAEIQAKILRVLEPGSTGGRANEFERVGGTETVSVNVRIIAATNKDLKAEIKAGRMAPGTTGFREDLYYRLCVIPIHLPALAERKEDIPLLANHFLAHFCRQYSLPDKVIPPAAMHHLVSHDWPGNIRELRNTIERLTIMTPGPDISPEYIREILELMPETGGENTGDASLKQQLQRHEKDIIIKALREQDGNVQQTAKTLGLDRSHLYKKMNFYGIR